MSISSDFLYNMQRDQRHWKHSVPQSPSAWWRWRATRC